MEPTTFAMLLRESLEAKSWSQKDLADYLDKNQATVSLWLSGTRPRSDAKLIRRLAEFTERAETEIARLIEGGGVASKRGYRQIDSLDQLRQVLGEMFPTDVAQVLAPRLSSVRALRSRLRERRYDAPVELLQAYVDQVVREGHLSDGDTPDWDLKTGTLRWPAPRVARQHWAEGELTVFRRAYRRDPTIREALRDICTRLNDRFAATERERLAESELTSEIHKTLELHNLPDRKHVAKAIVAGLQEVRFLEKELGESGHVLFRRRWILSASYLMNSLFGLKPHISGLRFLLDGGLLLPTGSGLSVLVEGAPGVGKTTFCLQLGASLAGAGYVVIYLTAEESPPFMTDRLSFAGYRRRDDSDGTERLVWNGEREERFIYEPANTIEESLQLTPWLMERDTGTGCLTLASIADRVSAFQSEKGNLRQELTALFARLKAIDVRCCLILDSIDAVTDQPDRRALEDLFNFARYQTDIGIFVTDVNRAAAAVQREHLADIVFKLGYRTRLRAFSERVLEIRKCRTQSHIRGRHMFSIHSDEGITIYGSIQSKLSIWRRRVHRGVDVEQESWRMDDDFDYDPVLRGDFVRGDAILLTGEPGTHKFPVGLSFLASGVRPDRNEHLLLISLRENDVAIRRVIENYPQFSPLLQALDNRGSGPKLSVLHFPPDYFSAERFIYWVERTLRTMRRDGNRVSRVLFSSLSQLKFNSPMFAAEPLFVAALIELFKKEMVTSLFISVGGEHRFMPSPGADWVEDPAATGNGDAEHGRRPPMLLTMGDSKLQEIGNVFDSIIFTSKRARKRGGEEIVLTVGHTAECNASRDPVPLRRPTILSKGRRGGYIGRLELDVSGITN
jgi:KaiC/GvpD/RAD55 family RecA-like ATPase/transcriptional regulator with XRE-family HTH domain